MIGFRLAALAAFVFLFSLALTGCGDKTATSPAFTTYVVAPAAQPKAPPECDPARDPAFPKLDATVDIDEEGAQRDRIAIKRHSRQIAGRRLVCHRWLEKTLQEPATAKKTAASS